MSSLPSGRLHEHSRRRPVAIVGQPLVSQSYDDPPDRANAATPHLAPSAAVEVGLSGWDAAGEGTVAVTLVGSDDIRLAATLTRGRVTLAVTTADGPTARRSRRHGHVAAPPERFAIALTGTHFTAFTHEAGTWVARGRIDLVEHIDPARLRDPNWLAGLTSGWSATMLDDADVPVTDWCAGDFGQLGLRDIRLVTRADQTAYRPDGEDGPVLLSATSAGPGFFDTAHTSLWRLDAHTLELQHASDLYFTRPDRPGVFCDHATHLVRDDDNWLVATSTWGDFEPPRKGGLRRGQRARPGTKSYVDITLATSTDDLTSGRHLLATEPLPMPTTDIESVGVWDPHLVRDRAGWLVGFVSARSYFDFHPALAIGPTLDRLTLAGAATDRRATEGVTLHRAPVTSGADGWVILASDGADNPRPIRRRYPVFDTGLNETGTIAAPYLSNIGWPTLVELSPRADGCGDWLMVTFDGTKYGGPLLGYGTHGDVVLMRT